MREGSWKLGAGCWKSEVGSRKTGDGRRKLEFGIWNLGFGIFCILMMSLTGCKSRKPMVDGAPPRIKEKELLEKVVDAENSFNTINMRASAQFEDKNSSQSFRLQVRMIKDSLIWLDIADPFIGIKVARAIVYRDSVAFVDNFNKKYYTGDLRSLQQKVNIDLGFSDLQQLFAGNLIIKPDDDYNMYYRPGHYLLANYPVETSDSAKPVFGNVKLSDISISLPYHKPSEQKEEEPALGRKYRLTYQNIKPVDELLYPEGIEVFFFQNTASTLKLKVQEVEKDKKLNYPFTIPSEYARMR